MKRFSPILSICAVLAILVVAWAATIEVPEAVGRTIVIGQAPAGCTDYTISLDDNAATSQRAITDGESGNMLATTWQTGHNGTIKSIEIYIANVVEIGGIMTGRFKNGSGSYSTDFATYDQTINSSAVNANGWFMFSFSTPVSVSSTDHLSFGVHSSVYAGPYWGYHTVASGGNAWDDGSGASWDAWNNDTAKNHLLRYTICY